jgi:hypothetical protein
VRLGWQLESWMSPGLLAETRPGMPRPPGLRHAAADPSLTRRTWARGLLTRCESRAESESETPNPGHSGSAGESLIPRTGPATMTAPATGAQDVRVTLAAGRARAGRRTAMARRGAWRPGRAPAGAIVPTRQWPGGACHGGPRHSLPVRAVLLESTFKDQINPKRLG